MGRDLLAVGAGLALAGVLCGAALVLLTLGPWVPVDVATPRARPTEAPNAATVAPTATVRTDDATLPVVLLATATAYPSPTPGVPPTPSLLPTNTPESACGPGMPVPAAGTLCRYTVPPTSAPLGAPPP